ncbi:hypothetical protein [Agaribacterium sp. ZY112]|uniref:hypothetical protein n=1 Tax=Agaribacterium sp. ZY112 TaxID=3233574 RepID=UPI0035232BC6
MSIYSKKLSQKAVWTSLLTVFVMVASLFLVVVFPENKVVHLILGSGRIFIFWLVIYSLVYSSELLLQRRRKR